MSKGYLTDQELYEIECAIYNDDNKTLFKSLPQGIEDNNKPEIIKDLAKGQEYYIIPETNFLIRKDGRMFNVKTIKALKVLWTPRDIIANLVGKQVRYSDIYKEMGWKFNHTAICKNYKDNDWPISITTGYKDKYRDYIADL